MSSPVMCAPRSSQRDSVGTDMALQVHTIEVGHLTKQRQVELHDVAEECRIVEESAHPL